MTARCPTCGNEFDTRGYQVVVPNQGCYDSVDCALASRELVPTLNRRRPARALPRAGIAPAVRQHA